MASWDARRQWRLENRTEPPTASLLHTWNSWGSEKSCNSAKVLQSKPPSLLPINCIFRTNNYVLPKSQIQQAKSQFAVGPSDMANCRTDLFPPLRCLWSDPRRPKPTSCHRGWNSVSSPASPAYVSSNEKKSIIQLNDRLSHKALQGQVIIS